MEEEKEETYMQIKVGVDVIEVERIKESIEDLGEDFAHRVFTDKEIKYCDSKKVNKYQHYAGRFAAKEAAFKAVSELLSDKYSLSWKNIEITNSASGKPKLEFISLDKKVEKELNKIVDKDISISHLKDYAIANVSIII